MPRDDDAKEAVGWGKAVEGWFYDYSEGLDTAGASEAGFFEDWYQELHKGTADPLDALLRAWDYVSTLNPEMREEIKQLLRGRPVSLADKSPRLGARYSLLARLDKSLEGCANREDVMSVDADLLLDLRAFVDHELTEMERQVHGLSARADLVDRRLQDFEFTPTPADPVEGEPVAIYQWTSSWRSERPRWYDCTEEEYESRSKYAEHRRYRILYTHPSVEGEGAREAPAQEKNDV